MTEPAAPPDVTPTAPPDACKNCGKKKQDHFVVNHVGAGVMIGLCPTSIYDPPGPPA